MVQVYKDGWERRCFYSESEKIRAALKIEGQGLKRQNSSCTSLFEMPFLVQNPFILIGLCRMMEGGYELSPFRGCGKNGAYLVQISLEKPSYELGLCIGRLLQCFLWILNTVFCKLCTIIHYSGLYLCR